jgi:hypothetical protein
VPNPPFETATNLPFATSISVDPSESPSKIPPAVEVIETAELELLDEASELVNVISPLDCKVIVPPTSWAPEIFIVWLVPPTVTD